MSRTRRRSGGGGTPSPPTSPTAAGGTSPTAGSGPHPTAAPTPSPGPATTTPATATRTRPRRHRPTAAAGTTTTDSQHMGAAPRRCPGPAEVLAGPTPAGASSYTYPGTGPGTRPPSSCSPEPFTDRRARADPTHTALTGRLETRVETPSTPAGQPRPAETRAQKPPSDPRDQHRLKTDALDPG